MSAKHAFLCCLSTMVVSASAVAANGDLDPGFGVGGIALGGLTNAAFELPVRPVVQVDGKIVVCTTLNSSASTGTDFLVARFNADGTPDTSFSFDGKVAIDFDGGLGRDACNGVEVQADGKIVAVGSSRANASNDDFAIARLEASGDLDTTFGAGTGKTLVNFDLGGNNKDIGSAIALQPDGKLVVAGSSSTASNGTDFAIVRLLDDGTRDTSFNLTGRVTVGFNLPGGTMKTDTAYDVLIDAQERILVGGAALKNASVNLDFAVARLLPGGQLDPNFDADGRNTLAFDLGPNGTETVYSMALQADGKILLGGYTDSSASVAANYDMAVARLFPDGSPDPGFGIGGKATVSFDLTPNGTDVAFGLVVQSNGYLLLGGVADHDTSSNYRGALARLRPGGTLDSQFGVQGKKTFNFGQFTPDSQLLLGIAQQGTQIIGSGLVVVGPLPYNYDLVVSRMQNDLLFAAGFD